MPMVDNSHCEVELLCLKIYIRVPRDTRRKTPRVLAPVHPGIRKYKDPLQIVGCKKVEAIERAMGIHRFAWVKYQE